MSIKYPGVRLLALALGFCTAFSASATPVYTPVVTVVDSTFDKDMKGDNHVVVDLALARQFSLNTGRFSNELSVNPGGNESSAQTIRFDRSQLLTGLVVSNVYDLSTPLSNTMPLVQYARLNLYDSNSQSLVTTVIKGSSDGMAYVDFGSGIAGIDTIVLTSHGGLSVSSPMGVVSSVFVGIPEPEVSALLLTGLLLLGWAVRSTREQPKVQ